MASIQTKKLIASITLGLVTAAALAVVQATPLLLFADPLAGQEIPALDIAQLQVGHLLPECQGQSANGKIVRLPDCRGERFTVIVLLPEDTGAAMDWTALQTEARLVRSIECYPHNIPKSKPGVEQLRLKLQPIPVWRSTAHLLVLDPKGILRHHSNGLPNEADWRKIRLIIEGVD